MAIGFSDRLDFRSIVGWELYQITLDKYHVMFWFDMEAALLNVADRFSLRSHDGKVNFTYEIYGTNKCLNIDRILRIKVKDVRIVSKEQLDLEFENGDVLSVYDNPDFRSWWFLGGRQCDPPGQRTTWALCIEDAYEDEMTDEDREFRLR